MKSVILPLAVVFAILYFAWGHLADAQKQEQLSIVQVQTSRKATMALEADLARNREVLANESAELARAQEFLRLWGAVYNNVPALDDVAITSLASRNGLMPMRKQRSLPAPVALPSGIEVKGVKMNFQCVGQFARTLRMLGDMESSFALANFTEARFTNSGGDLVSSFVVYYPSLQF